MKSRFERNYMISAAVSLGPVTSLYMFISPLYL
jgi:hypothetical protein